jgi:hypothetical protein
LVLEAEPDGSAGCKDKRAAVPQEIVIVARRFEAKDAGRSHTASTAYGAPDDKGEFAISGLASGSYYFGANLLPDGWYVKAVTGDTAQSKPSRRTAPPKQGRAGPFSMKAGEHIEGVNVMVAEGAAALAGQVVPKTGSRLPPGLRVHLVPTKPEGVATEPEVVPSNSSGPEHAPRDKEFADDILRYAESPVAADGTFAFRNLAPGRYRVVANTMTGEPSVEGDPYPAAWSAANRKALQREAESSGKPVDLKRCQRISDYTLRYEN